jgi:hypothetical protein
MAKIFLDALTAFEAAPECTSLVKFLTWKPLTVLAVWYLTTKRRAVVSITLFGSRWKSLAGMAWRPAFPPTGDEIGVAPGEPAASKMSKLEGMNQAD